jgi:biotin carboxyl carrier protein
VRKAATVPTFDVTVRGKTYHIEIPDPGAVPLRVVVDGQPFDVDIAGLASRPLRSPAPAARVASEPLVLPAMPALAAARSVSTESFTGSGDIRAPMPGTILSVSVKQGQAVEPGDVLCVLEAMKMKNPIRATQAGTVGQIEVQPGQTVAHGDLLARIE